MDDLHILKMLENKVRWLATWMVHHANHLRDAPGEVKVGGHQASSASLSTIMTVLYFQSLERSDRVAVKPHASPNMHAIQYLLGHQTLDKLKNFRGFGGAQSYPSRTKDTCQIDFSTGSVGLGAAQTIFASLVQDYIAHQAGGALETEGRMIALVGDAEMDEGNIFEALLEGWKHGLRNTWWIIDYNRQSLDAVVHEGLWQRLEEIFKGFGWDVVVLRYGSLLQEAFDEPGGQSLKSWIDDCSNQLYSILSFKGGAAWRERLLADLGHDPESRALIERRSDAQLATLMCNLGGHDAATLMEAFSRARRHERPVCFLAYTIKGYGLPLAGHKDNHAGLLTQTQIEDLRDELAIRCGHEWDILEAMDGAEAVSRFLHDRREELLRPERPSAPPLAVPQKLEIEVARQMSTQQGFGQIMRELGKSDLPLASAIVTTSPDVTVSTNLAGWVNARGRYARERRDDLFRAEKVASGVTWSGKPNGQHIELGIAEMNLFLTLSAFGLSHSLFGHRFIPIGTVYDPFIKRGLDALNYACYQDARFILVATPSGITLAPEGGAHQSIATPLIGMAQDGLASFEPAFVDELAEIMRFAFDYVQRNDASRSLVSDGEGPLADEKGGSIYLRLTTRVIEQPTRPMTSSLCGDILKGGYWMRRPGSNCQLVICYQGAVAPEAIAATGLLAQDFRDIGLLAVTSADRLQQGWRGAQRAREEGKNATSHVETLLGDLPDHCRMVTVMDAHPSTLAWLGSVYGHKSRALGVEYFGQCGTIAQLYRQHGLDATSIVHAADALLQGRGSGA